VVSLIPRRHTCRSGARVRGPRRRALHQVINDIADSAAQDGVQKLVIINGDGGNYVLSNIVQTAGVGPGPALARPDRGHW
jgi:creatinine amidohydrolase